MIVDVEPFTIIDRQLARSREADERAAARAVPHPIAADGYPRNADDATGGEVGDLNRRLTDLVWSAGPDSPGGQLADLQCQQLDYEATIRNARPDGDMAAVAAAEAGLRVIRPYLEQAREGVRRDVENIRVAREKRNERWREAERLRSEIRRRHGAYGRADPAIKAQLHRLLGPPVPPDAANDARDGAAP